METAALPSPPGSLSLPTVDAAPARPARPASARPSCCTHLQAAAATVTGRQPGAEGVIGAILASSLRHHPPRQRDLSLVLIWRVAGSRLRRDGSGTSVRPFNKRSPFTGMLRGRLIPVPMSASDTQRQCSFLARGAWQAPLAPQAAMCSVQLMVLADWDDVRPLWNEGDRGVLVLHHACMDVLVHVIDHVYTRQRLFGLVQSLHGRAGQGQSHPMRLCACARVRICARAPDRANRASLST